MTMWRCSGNTPQGTDRDSLDPRHHRSLRFIAPSHDDLATT
jgi:hypothetical protein